MSTGNLPTDPLARVEALVVRLDEKLDSYFDGRPAQGQPGIWIRLDRAEQFIRAALFIATTAILAAVGAIVSAFTGHK